MIPLNGTAMDFELKELCEFGYSSGGGQNSVDHEQAGSAVTFGSPYSAGVQGFLAVFTEGPVGAGSLDFNLITWAGTYSAAVATGIGYGYWRCYISQALLTGTVGGAWTLAHNGITFYLSVNGGAETTILAIPAGSLSGTNYQECLNTITNIPTIGPLHANPIPAAFGDPVPCDGTIGITQGSSASSILMTGGYRFLDDGVWTADPVLFDTSQPGGGCGCNQLVPNQSGVDSWTTVVGANFSTSFTEGAAVGTTCGGPCPEPQAYQAQFILTNEYSSTSISILSKDRPVPGEAVTTEYVTHSTTGPSTVTCSLSGGGSSSFGTPPTYCLGGRNVQYWSANVWCLTGPPSCVGMGGCILTVGTGCDYQGSTAVTCSAFSPVGRALGYDVSNAQRHVLVYGLETTNELMMGCAGNVLPQSYTWVDTGLTGTWARPRFQDLGSSWPIGLFYGDGTNCYWSQSFDEGRTWGTVVSMGSGGIGDFEEGANGLRWFFKLETPDSGATWNVWNRLADSQLNVVRDWTVTNVTGIDDAPIAVRESPASDGSWRIGLFYSIGGVQTVKFSQDGLNFS